MRGMAIIIAALALAGCAIFGPTRSSRISYVESHPNLPPRFFTAIQGGIIMKGMTKQDVVAAWGNPCGYCYGTTHNSWGDSWEYNVFGSSSYGIGNGKYVFFSSDGLVTGWSGH